MCAEGGALTSCSEAAPTAQGACWRMVDCGAILIKSDPANPDNRRFDWGECVDTIETTTDIAAQLIIGCIRASTCDALKVPGSPDRPDVGQMVCFRLGGQ